VIIFPFWTFLHIHKNNNFRKDSQVCILKYERL
jgi:hypothetical protein